MKKKKLSILMSLVMTASLSIPVFADNLIVDGDALTPVSASTLNLGSVAPGAIKTGNVVLAISRQGEGNVFHSGKSIEVSFQSSNDNNLSASMSDSSITTPNTWTDNVTKNNTLTSDTAYSTVTLSVPTNASVGFHTARLSYRATGLDSDGINTLERSGEIEVNYTVTAPVDIAAPVISGVSSDIIAEATGKNGAVVTYIQPTAIDNLDGVVSVTCTPASGSTFGVGTTTVNCSATDAHGNTATGSFTVTVKYNFTGFFQPIDINGVVNTMKAGSAVPIKFSLGGNMGLTVFATGYPTSAQVKDFAATLPSDAVETVIDTAGNSTLTYDASTGIYTYVWKTDKAWAGTCRQLNVKFNDGTIVPLVNFKFSK
jgi:hypothetical protein